MKTRQGKDIAEIYNVFLDFLNRDSREIYGLYRNTSLENHISLLNEAINVAVFLCADFCVMPPGFFLEDQLAQQALLRCKEYFLDRLIRMPLREEGLDTYFEKKQREYRPLKKKYTGLFDSSNQGLLKSCSNALIPRLSKIGFELAKQWEEGPDRAGIWKQLIEGMQPRDIGRIRSLPKSIHQKGTAVTWAAIEKEIDKNIGVDHRRFRYAVQNHYFRIYMDEFNCRIITNLPFSRTNFFLESGELDYDYEALKGALSAIRLWRIVKGISAISMIRLRTRHGYFAFRDAFAKVARKCKIPGQVIRAFALGAQRIRWIYQDTRLLEKYDSFQSISLPYGFILSDDAVEAAAIRLDAVSQVVIQAHNEISFGDIREDRLVIGGTKKRIIAIFVALQMEREILIKHLNLKTCYPPELAYFGKFGSTEVIVFGPDDMGRVPAAIATMEFLKKREPDLLIVAGIAGGFEKEGSKLGDVVIARSIVDLATRKLLLEDDAKITITEFRPREWPTDNRLEKYLKYGFDRTAWEQDAVQYAEWPEGKRPTIKYGTLASLDEVVSSNEWMTKLLQAWPKLLGVEMEAGGVCAAAFAHDIKVAVIRGISDLADPAKSDDEWRRRAMKTISHLLKNIEYDAIFELKD